MNWLETYEARKFLQELMTHPAETAMGLLFIAMAFSLAQRKWIKRRDGNKSQMRHYSEERGWHTSDERPGDTIEVHHIKPQASGGG